MTGKQGVQAPVWKAATCAAAYVTSFILISFGSVSISLIKNITSTSLFKCYPRVTFVINHIMQSVNASFEL